MIYTGKFYFSEKMAILIDQYNKITTINEKQPEHQITNFVISDEVITRPYGDPDNPPPPQMATEKVYTAKVTIGIERPLEYHIEMTDYDWKILEGDTSYPTVKIIRTAVTVAIFPPIIAVVKPPIKTLKKDN